MATNYNNNIRGLTADNKGVTPYAYVNFGIFGSPTASSPTRRSYYNVSSVSRLGTGRHKVTMATKTYLNPVSFLVFVAGGWRASNDANCQGMCKDNSLVSVETEYTNTAGSLTDVEIGGVVVFSEGQAGY